VHWPAAVVFGLVWGMIAAGWRFSSLASLGATAAVVVYYLLFGQAGLPFIVLMAALIFVKHQANIRRLLSGEETRIGARS